MAEYQYEQLTGQIINSAHKVHNALGYGFLEKIYHNAMLVELKDRSIKVETQKPVTVYYSEHIVGEYFADLVVEEKVIVEIKSVEELNSTFEAQLLNYLKAMSLTVGLIINFGSSVQVKRMVL